MFDVLGYVDGGASISVYLLHIMLYVICMLVFDVGVRMCVYVFYVGCMLIGMFVAMCVCCVLNCVCGYLHCVLLE